VKFSVIVLAIALLFLIGCEDEVPQSSVAEFQAQRSELNARVARKNAKSAGKQTGAAAAAAVEAGAEPQYGSLGSSFGYDPIGKRDPFRTYMWERLEIVGKSHGPLEQFDVSQLSVVAVIWSTGNARAMIQDPSGQGHVVGVGARVGKNDGRVMSIDDNLVVVKEAYEDYLGQVTKKDIEMRIRRPSKGGGVDVRVY
jgi:Tfp pilus assembly protein PilP